MNTLRTVATLLSLMPLSLLAEVRVDGSLGGGNAGDVQTGNGFTYDITEGLGEVAGSNLFHSFSEFNIASGESANFSGQSIIENIIARVTSDSASSIQGLVSSSITGASLWFFNPNGVVISDGAQFDFDGSVNLGTFSSITFSDGTSFSADLASSASVLSVGDPNKYGFLPNLTNASLSFQNTDLVFKTGQSLNFIAQDVSFNQSSVKSESGAIRILASGGLDEISLGDNEALASSELGRINLEDSSLVDVSGAIGGDVDFIAKQIVLDRSKVLSESFSDFQTGMSRGRISLLAENIDLNNSSIVASAKEDAAQGQTAATLVSDVFLIADREINLKGKFNFVFSNAFANGSDGGTVNISAPNVLLDDSTLSISARNDAMGSTLNINSTNLTLQTDADITADMTSGATPRELVINTQKLLLDSGSTISADGFGQSAGIEILINANELNMGRNTEIAGQTTDNSGGGITLNVKGVVSLADEASITTENFGSGEGADIRVSAGTLLMESGAQINASALNTGVGGDITIEVRGVIDIDGSDQSASRKTEISSKSGDVNRAQSGLINNPGYGEGDGGRIRLVADSITLRNGAAITGISGITNDIVIGRPVTSGNAGSIELVANSLDLSNGASIETQSIESSGGSVRIEVKDFIGISDSQIKTNSLGASAQNPGGDIFIDPQLLVFNDALINANANAGNGGNIQIIADNIIRDQNTVITASSNQGIDGDISIDGVTNEVSSLVLMDVDFADVSSLLSQRCSVAQLSDRSSFVVADDEGTVTQPSSYRLASNQLERHGDDWLMPASSRLASVVYPDSAAIYCKH